MHNVLPVTIRGVVTRFSGDGRKLGYPTANLTTETDLTDGIYFGLADLNSFVEHPALIFIGTPTTMGAQKRRIEVHLLDIPDQDYYELLLTATMLHYHRPNQTFASVSELQAVLADDEIAGRKWFQEYAVANKAKKDNT